MAVEVAFQSDAFQRDAFQAVAIPDDVLVYQSGEVSPFDMTPGEGDPFETMSGEGSPLVLIPTLL